MRASTNTPTLSVIIVTWNSASYIAACLESVAAAARRLSFEIIVVDNASSDQTCNIVRRNFPNALLIAEKNNRGFGAGNMRGFALARGWYILLLNPDTVLSERTLLKSLQWLLKNPKVGAVGPRQLNEFEREIFTFSHLSAKGALEIIYRKFFSRDTLRLQKWFLKPRRVPFLNLGCVLTRRSLWTQEVRFDSRLFLYGEELDLFAKIRKAGWQTVYLPAESMYHFREKSMQLTGKKNWYVFESYCKVLWYSLAGLVK